MTPSPAPVKVGIVVVSYNASLAVRVTLASLRQAENEAPSRLVLVDNASLQPERDQIRAALEKHVQEARLPWEYLQETTNRGFAGGNNAAIGRLLEDPGITHICLLNSDVIVADHWLDHLLEPGGSIVSAVTNQADSDQRVPVDYQVQLDECLDERTERIPARALSRVSRFADDWHRAWRGNWVEGDATFFCVLVARRVFEEVGLLDETFFPGGYEDNDFAIRAKARGFQAIIARDVFIHHWGSASFGLLQPGYFSDRARHNRQYLESKHGIALTPGVEKPFVSYGRDLAYAVKTPEETALRRRFNRLYSYQLGALLESLETEYRNLKRAIGDTSASLPGSLRAHMQAAEAFDDVPSVWKKVAAQSGRLLEPVSAGHEADAVLADLQYVVGAIARRGEFVVAARAFLPATKQTSEHASTPHASRTDLWVRLKPLFPSYTARGQALRWLWRSFKSLARGEVRPGRPPGGRAAAAPPPPGECEILVQVDDFEAGGLENAALDLNQALIAAGHKLVLMVLGKEGAAVQRARQQGMQVLIGSPKQEYIEGTIQALRPRLVLAHYSIHGAELYHRAGIPFVQVIHNAYMWLDSRQVAAFRAATSATTAFIPVSDYVRDYSVRRLGVPEERCVVLPWGVHGAAFKRLNASRGRQDLRSAHDLGAEDFVFLSVGAVNYQKNHIGAVRAFASIADRMPRARLAILGPANERSLLEEIQLFIEQHGLTSRVSYLGAVQEAYPYYAMADALVSASFFEGCALSILEALRANLPIVMTRVGLFDRLSGVPGIQLVDPPLDISDFHGRIWQLRSNRYFEECLAGAMLQTYEHPRRPGLPAPVLGALDQSEALKPYVELIEDLLQGKPLSARPLSTWTDQLVQRS